MKVYNMLGGIEEAIRNLQAVKAGLELVVDDGEALSNCVDDNEKVLKKAWEYIEKVASLRHTSIALNMSRPHRHVYESPGDPTPRIVPFGPSKITLTVQYDPHEYNRAYKKEQKAKGISADMVVTDEVQCVQDEKDRK